MHSQTTVGVAHARFCFLFILFPRTGDERPCKPCDPETDRSVQCDTQYSAARGSPMAYASKLVQHAGH